MSKEKDNQDEQLRQLHMKLGQLESALGHQADVIQSLQKRLEVIEAAMKGSRHHCKRAADPLNFLGLLWTPFHGDPAPLLNSFPLTNDLGRRSFLATLYWAYQKGGIIAATNHVWDCLEEPKAVKAKQIGNFVGVAGRSKSAIRHALERFLQDTASIQVPDLPDKQLDQSFEEWNDECILHFQQLERHLNVYLVRYSIALNGGNP
jgi:hypothetical protein